MLRRSWPPNLLLLKPLGPKGSYEEVSLTLFLPEEDEDNTHF